SRQPRQKTWVLEDEAGWGGFGGGFAVDGHATRKIAVYSGDEAQERRFAYAGWAENCCHATGRYLGLEAGKRGGRAASVALFVDGEGQAWAGRHRRTLRSSGRSTPYSTARTTVMKADV